MHVPTGLRVQGWNVALGALRGSAEERLPACGSRGIEGAGCSPRRGERELVQMEPRELRGHEVRRIRRVPQLRTRSNGELVRIVEPRIEEIARAVHFENRNEGVP